MNQYIVHIGDLLHMNDMNIVHYLVNNLFVLNQTDDNHKLEYILTKNRFFFSLIIYECTQCYYV